MKFAILLATSAVVVATTEEETAAVMSMALAMNNAKLANNQAPMPAPTDTINCSKHNTARNYAEW